MKKIIKLFSGILLTAAACSCGVAEEAQPVCVGPVCDPVLPVALPADLPSAEGGAYFCEGPECFPVEVPEGA